MKRDMFARAALCLVLLVLGWEVLSASAGSSAVSAERARSSATGSTPRVFLPIVNNASVAGPPPTSVASATATPLATGTPTPTTTPTKTAIAAYATTILGDGPQAYWRLDETSGTTFNDSTGNGHTGDLVSAVTLGAPGALASDPTDASVLLGSATKNHIDIPQSSNLSTFNTIGGVSLEAWVNPISVTGTGIPIVAISSPNNMGSFILTITTSGANAGQISFGTGISPPSTMAFASSAVGAAPNGQWTYVVGTYDGTTLALYVNGALVASQAASGTLGVGITNAFLGGKLYQGNLDEVAVYGRALTASQVQAHFAAATGAPPLTGTATSIPTVTMTSTGSPIATSTLTPTPTSTPGSGAMAWGGNHVGELGNGTTITSTVPVAILNLANVTTLGGGGFHSLAVESDGTVWGWGNNTFGQLGDGTTSGGSETGVPTPVQAVGVTGAMAVAGGGIATIGQQHSLVLKSDGTVWGFGSNVGGQLGDGTTTSPRLTAVQALGLSNVTAIAAGGQHSLALSGGTVWAFGFNGNGQLGIGNTITQTTPVQITALSGIVAIAAGGNHSLAVKSDGTVWAWGDNSSGQLGVTTTQTCGGAACSMVPVQVSGVTGALLTPSAVAAGNLHSLVVKSDGTVWAWGDNTVDELGNGSTGGMSTTPAQVSNLSGVTAISSQANARHSLALKSDKTVWAWGSNSDGQLGDGTKTNRSAPVQVTGLTAVASIAAGGEHSLALEATNPQVTADPSGQVENFDSNGSINTTGAFFQSLGTNGRTCATCHIESQGWSITPAFAQSVMTGTQGIDPLFTLNDGTNSPNADVSTFSKRVAASSMLIQRGDFRIGIAMPTNAEFTLTQAGINDPYNFATPQQLSLFRRPVPATNLGFLSSVMWDGRETHQAMTTTNTIAQNLAALTFDLSQQSVDATTGHAQASVTPTTAQQSDMVSFELALATAQGTDNAAGSLTALGATGGSQNLATQVQGFTIGENDFSSPGFNPIVFTLFQPWETLNLTDTVSLARESIGRGEVLFNTRQFQMTGVNGLNDVLNQPTIVGTCSTCHNTFNVGSRSVDGEFNTGVAAEIVGVDHDFPTYTFTNNATAVTTTTTDPGEGLITGKWADIGKFKVPTLRGLAARAPYFHNGVGTTLNDVVNSYNLRFSIGFTPQDETDLVNFLNAL
jgi:alpha-tubulin suppressor-like RCC1 family protein